MSDSPPPPEEPAVLPSPPDFPGSRPTQVLASPTSTHWWQRPVPLWWSILLGMACLLLGASTTLWAFGLPRRNVDPPAAAVQQTVRFTPGNPQSPAAGLILPVTASPVAVATASPTPTRPPTTAPPQPTVTTTPTAQPVALAAVQRAYEDVLEGRDPLALRAALKLLDQPEVAQLPGAADLRSRLLYASDALSGTVYLGSDNTVRWTLLDEAGAPLVQPIDLTISDDALYVIDSATLYRREWATLPAAGGTVTLTAVITRGATIGGYPVKEIVAADATGTGRAIYVLDKSGDIYFSETGASDWILSRTAVQEQVDPDPFLLSITTYANRLYGLDPAQNQVWRHPPKDGSLGVLPGTLPWLVQPGEPDVSDGLDLAIDGRVFVLLRDGSVVNLTPAVAGYYRLSVAEGRSHVQQLASVPSRPLSIALDTAGPALYVADPDRRRVVALDRNSGAFLGQVVAADNPDFARLHAVAERDGRLLMLAGPSVYVYEPAGWITATLSLTGALPTWVPETELDPVVVRVQDLYPNDPRLVRLLASRPFTMPLPGMVYLPDRASAYPGARRGYRYGVHEGLDFYNNDAGIEVKVGTPVYAVADGIVARADQNYVTLTITETQALLDDASARHFTPPDTLDKLGGRQVWLDHGGGLMTRYLHLSAIPEGVQAGQSVKAGDLIGYVGLSGTVDELEGRDYFAHLHFEMWTGPEWRYAVGQWLTIEDTRRIYEQLFKASARPKDWKVKP